jgi:integrase/recombinase XerD
MLAHVFLRTGVIARLRGGPLGPYLDDLATSFHHQGYAPSSMQRYLRASDQFGRWLQGQGYGLKELAAAVLHRYIAGLTRDRSGHLPKAAQGLNHLWRFLQRQGVVPQRHTMTPLTPLEPWLAEYDAYLAQVVGLALSTRQYYRRIVSRFMITCFGAETPDWQAVTATMITAFVRQEAIRCQGAGRKLPGVAIRALLRFLVFRGEIRPGLEAAAPSPPQWRHASLPSRLTPEEVERVLAVSHDGSASSLRHRAMLMCLARLGLRAQDVIMLHLDDIDWADGRFILRPGKARRTRSLPLPQDVGHAVVAYIQGGRPRSESRQGFLRCRPPFQPLTNSAVWWVVRQAFQQAGLVTCPGMASHLFRHTAASQMLNHGASFKEVADVLGHQSLQTTGIYAKLELEALAAVALPWGGVGQ